MITLAIIINDFFMLESPTKKQYRNCRCSIVLVEVEYSYIIQHLEHHFLLSYA